MRPRAYLAIALLPLFAACAPSEHARLAADAKNRPPAAAPLSVGSTLPANAKLVPVSESLRTMLNLPETPFMPQLFELEYIAKYSYTLSDAEQEKIAEQLRDCRAYWMDCRVVSQ